MVFSLKFSRRLFQGLSSYKLAPLSSSLGIRFEGFAHRAEADAQVSADSVAGAPAQAEMSASRFRAATVRATGAA